MALVSDEASTDDPEPDDGVTIAALEVRLPLDTLLVVEAPDGESWMVVHASAELDTVTELPERHADFIDAVDYVATVADKASGQLPVVDPRDGLEAFAIFDGEDGVLVVVKEGEHEYVVSWVDDEGDVEIVDRYATAKEAILLPVLDEDLFTDVE